ncbi:hypothetical protein G6F22_021528 [Rhizopus arrhizus]|nr:hypothetical protein G6F22_021528 [Rhizopus arrhizus]
MRGPACLAADRPAVTRDGGLPHLTSPGGIGQRIGFRFPSIQSPLCGRRIQDRPSSAAHLPSGCREQYLRRAGRPLRHRPSHKSDTSKYA